MGARLIQDCEDRLAELSERWGNGDLTEAEFNQRVADLEVSDSRGFRWRLSPANGNWMCWNGTRWVEGGRPADAVESPGVHPSRRNLPEGIPEPREEPPRGIKPRVGRFFAILLALLLLAYGIGLPVLHGVGPRATGVVTRISDAGMDETGNSRNYSVSYRFVLPDGAEETGSYDLSADAMAHHGPDVGDPIEVRYIPGHPRFNFAASTTRLNLAHGIFTAVGLLILFPPGRRRK